jgi:hypothetical protein
MYPSDSNSHFGFEAVLAPKPRQGRQTLAQGETGPQRAPLKRE